MEATRNILLVLHFVGLAALFGGFLAQIASPVKNVAAGMMHGALLSLIAGLGLVGVRTSLHGSDPTNWPPTLKSVKVKTPRCCTIVEVKAM